MSDDFEQAKSRVCQSEGTYVTMRPLVSSWEQRKLGDCFEFLKNNALSRADLNSENGTARNVHYGDILIKFGDCLDGERSDLPFITDDTVLPKFAGSILREGDVIFADTAEDEAAGKCVELRKLPKEPTISGLHTIPARPRFPFGTGYLGHYLNSDAYHRQLLPLMQGIKVISVSKAALQDTQVRFPDLSEQTTIGAALSEIDTLITLHQRKCQYRGLYGYLSWEQRKLGELMDVTSVRRVHQEDWTDEGVRFLRARDLVAFARNEPIDDPLFISEEMYQEYSALSGKVSVGDLLVTGVGTIGVPWLVTSENPIYFKDGNIIWFKNAGEIDGEFFFHSFIAGAIQSYINEAAGIGTVGTYTIETGKKTPIWLPAKQEQRCVAAFMTCLDNLITLHQRKLELLRNIKKSLLDRMFV